MLAHTRAAKKHAKILLFSDLGKFYHEKLLFLGDFLYKNQFCHLDFTKTTPVFHSNYPCINNLDKVINRPTLPAENPFSLASKT
jgi:hypothetical protein